MKGRRFNETHSDIWVQKWVGPSLLCDIGVSGKMGYTLKNS